MKLLLVDIVCPNCNEQVPFHRSNSDMGDSTEKKCMHCKMVFFRPEPGGSKIIVVLHIEELSSD